MSRQFASDYVGITSEADLGKLDPHTRHQITAASDKRAALMSPPGKLDLPELLEARRLAFGITDRAFSFQPFHDKVLVHQIQGRELMFNSELGIVKPGQTVERDRKTAPVGVIVAAGALALDHLRCNGMDLGHIVMFQRLAPWRFETELDGSLDAEVVIMRTGDIVGSVDLGDAIRSGEVRIGYNTDTGEHVYVNTKTGEMWRPNATDPHISGDQ